MRKLVIIPTYNEKENVLNIIDAVLNLNANFHVLIIDDGSPDGTAEIVQSKILNNPNEVFLEQRTGKQGLGTAYIHGFRWALKNNYDFIFEMDADFSHDPKDLLRLFEACQNGADVAVGSRYVRGGGFRNWPLKRNLLSKGGSLYTRVITFLPVKDPTAGFVCYTKKVLETIDLAKIHFVGYAFQIEMKFAAWRLGFTIKEVPIIFQDRTKGDSKMNKGIIKEGIVGVLKLKWLSFFTDYHRVMKNEE